MNALLIYPEFPDTFWSFKHALKFIRKRATLPPLGLLTVAAMLPDSWSLRLTDLNVEKLGERDLQWADIVLISAMVVQRESARALVVRCKAAGKIVVAGGPLFADPDDQFPEVDHFVLNEAEITLPGFLSDLERGVARRIYAARPEEYPDIGTSPTPRWELAKLSRYASMAVQYSRGCPFDCEFCDVTAKFGHRPRVKSSGQVITELEGLVRRGWRGPVFFVDDNLIGNKRALKTDLLPAITDWQARRGGLPLYTEASINLADDAELMGMMSRAGFDMVFVGIETPDDAGLAECNKRQNRGRDLIADIKRIQRAGLQVQGGFIVGFDSDLPTIFRRQAEFIQKSGIVTAMVGLLNAMPGTKLHARLEREGRLLGRSTGDNADGATNFTTRMSRETLSEGYKSILRGIYAPKPYYARVRTFLREYKRPRFSVPLDWRRMFAFSLSSVRLGVVGRERFQYWRLLAWTAFHRPSLTPMAVMFAIYGHHFWRCCETMGV